MNNEIQQLIDLTNGYIEDSCDQLKQVRDNRHNDDTHYIIAMAVTGSIIIASLVSAIVLNNVLLILGAAVFAGPFMQAFYYRKESWGDWSRLERDIEDHLETQFKWRDEYKSLAQEERGY